jgi:hypothetical protein
VAFEVMRIDRFEEVVKQELNIDVEEEGDSLKRREERSLYSRGIVT